MTNNELERAFRDFAASLSRRADASVHDATLLALTHAANAALETADNLQKEELQHLRAEVLRLRTETGKAEIIEIT